MGISVYTPYKALRDHRKNAKAYNNSWDKFWDRNENPTKEEILREGEKIMNEYFKK